MTEAYKLDCFACGRTITVPHDGELACPLCGAVQRIVWKAGRRPTTRRTA